MGRDFEGISKGMDGKWMAYSRVSGGVTKGKTDARDKDEIR